MRLYSGPLSLFTAKVRIALDEKGLPYERIEVGWSLADRYLPHHPEVIRRNPKGEVPVLVDGGLDVYDSTQILEYLEDRYPEPPLYPDTPEERARCRRLEAAADEIIFPSVWDLIEGGFYTAATGGPDGERIGRATKALGAHYAELDRQLRGRAYLCERFGVADIGTFIMVSSATILGAPPAGELVDLGAWLGRMRERPAVAREIDAMSEYAARALQPAA